MQRQISREVQILMLVQTAAIVSNGGLPLCPRGSRHLSGRVAIHRPHVFQGAHTKQTIVDSAVRFLIDRVSHND
jgi:hypothetical protein